jgi:hypothetical protein
MSTDAPTNRLRDETSPYLLQHAENPVAWQPWDDRALDSARREGKPILLSIGYSACHWCHVMAHESFEDAATAQVMNELFVNIKVDREERPDLDKIYQTAHAILTQRPGGWPLTMFLTAEDQVPFFGGTYFPDTARHGMPAFKDLLRRVAEFHREHRSDIEKQNASMVEALHSLWGRAQVAAALDPGLVGQARRQLEPLFDATHGGFGQAPKFPHPSSLERLLRDWASSVERGEPDQPVLHMARFTLEKMCNGGVYDQLGGGFYRYSVDAYWMIPHFEKMLYDNGPLLGLCAETAAATGDPLFARAARETADWVIREMQAPEGGYFSTLDADSEGEEGKFYAWDRDEVGRILDPEDYPLLAARYGLDQTPNFEGRWHLHGFAGIDALAEGNAQTPEEITTRLDAARRRLFEARERRVRPGRDEKILTAWNALMIKGMARAARHLGEPDWQASAERALAFIRAELWRDGRLLATYKDGRARLAGYLDDYAFLLDALLELLQLRWSESDLALARDLAEVLLDHFQDHEHGGFFFTADDHERLVQRPKAPADEATPSGSGVAALALNRLGHLLGEPRYLVAAERTLRDAAATMTQAPGSHCTLLSALEEHLDPPQIVILRGAEPQLGAWRRRVATPYAPRRLSLAIPNDAEGLPEMLATKAPRGDAVAYICTGTTCSAPVDSLEDLDRALAPPG